MPLPVVPDGFTAKYSHRRNPQEVRIGPLVHLVGIAPKGGATVAQLLDAERNVVAQGTARCAPQDNYNKRIGRAIALGRALKALNGDSDG